jgi:5-methylcytosine-specific restriction endonuclease McrA
MKAYSMKPSAVQGRKWYASLSPERLMAQKKYQADRRRKKYATLSREQRASEIKKSVEYWRKHPTERRAHAQKWKASLSPERRVLFLKNHAAANRRWRERNKQHCAEYSRKWGKLHPKYGTENSRKWRAANPGRSAMALRKWRKTPKGRACVAENRHYRRAKIKGHFDAKIAIQAILSRKSRKCFYCAKRFPVVRIQIEHIKPLARGGEHAAYNLVAACPHCNQTKNRKLPSEFIKRGQLILEF